MNHLLYKVTRKRKVSISNSMPHSRISIPGYSAKAGANGHAPHRKRGKKPWVSWRAKPSGRKWKAHGCTPIWTRAWNSSEGQQGKAAAASRDLSWGTHLDNPRGGLQRDPSGRELKIFPLLPIQGQEYENKYGEGPQGGPAVAHQGKRYPYYGHDPYGHAHIYE